MADPVIANGIRAQVVFEGASGFPEDRFITTWAFERDDLADITPADEEEVASRLEEFFMTAVGAGDPLRTWIGRQASTPAIIRTYDLGETPPRTPTEFSFEIGVTTAESFPAEVALCLSFYSLVNQPRSRGRVFIGPLADQAAVFADGEVRPDPAFITALAGSASRLAAYPAPLSWGVLSQADATIKTITNGWVDNAFDTQRRRGLDATARTLWS